MTDSPRFELLVQQLEAAITTATDLKSTVVVELLRMAILATYEEGRAAELDWSDESDMSDGEPGLDPS